MEGEKKHFFFFFSYELIFWDELQIHRLINWLMGAWLNHFCEEYFFESVSKHMKNNIPAARSFLISWLKICSFPQCCKVPRRKCTKYVPFNLQNSPLQCQNSAQTKVLPGRKGAEQCCGMQAIAAVKACADHDTLDQALECAWLLPPSFPFSLPPSLFLLVTPDHPTEGAEGEKG